MAVCIRIVRKISLLTAVFITAYYLYPTKDGQVSNVHEHGQHQALSTIHLAVVACEGKTKRVLTESVTMIKSALIFTKSPLHVHIFTETLKDDFEKVFMQWPSSVRNKFEYSIHPVQYPLSQDYLSEFKNWWGPCASFRLFLPEVLHRVDSLIYVDSDVLFLIPVDEIWAYFSQFNEKQVGALAPRVGWEFNVPSSNPNFIMKPDGKLTQVNSGVFLMNLTRMREARFSTDPKLSLKTAAWDQHLLLPLYRTNKKDMYGDQNLINVLFHYNPDLLHYLPCNLNYHHKFCFDDRRDRFCDWAEREGAAVVHGSANTFYNNYSPAFGAVNDAMRQYAFEEDIGVYLLQPMLRGLMKPEVNRHEHCGGRSDLFTKRLKESIRNAR